MADIERVAAYSAPFFTDDESVMGIAADEVLEGTNLSEEEKERLRAFAVQVGISGLHRFMNWLGNGTDVDLHYDDGRIKNVTLLEKDPAER